MGDASDRADVGRFLRCAEGREFLASLAARLEGRRVASVEWTNEADHVGMVLHLEDGGCFVAALTFLDVGAIRCRFEAALDREYYRDYPDRRPA